MARNLANVVDAAAQPITRKPVVEIARTLRGRAIFMGSPSLAFDCMRDALGDCGIDADACSFEQGIPACRLQYDVFLLFLVRYEASSQSVIRRRMDELRERMAAVPAVALIEDTDTDAASLRQMGFSTVVAGLPSLRFAVDLVRLILISARSSVIKAEIPKDADTPDDGQSGADAAVCFTPREVELLEFLRRGMPNKIIAHQLGISQSTVKAHLHNIMAKLHAKNRTQAICMLGRDVVGKNSHS
jgi:DNA-binding NarL/FixJ family response regulator